MKSSVFCGDVRVPECADSATRAPVYQPRVGEGLEVTRSGKSRDINCYVRGTEGTFLTLTVGLSPIIQAGIKMSSVHKRPAPEEIDNPAMNVMMTPLRSDTTGKEVPFWASDHKSSTVMPEKTAVPSSPRWGKCRCPPNVNFWAPPTLSG